MSTKFMQRAREELASADLRCVVGNALVAPIPSGSAGRVRAHLLRAVGFRIGPRTLIMSAFTVIGGSAASTRLAIGSDCFLNHGCVFDAAAEIDIGDRVSLGVGVLITTSAHAIDHPAQRAGTLEPHPVHVGAGAWIASSAVLLPGVVIGDGAVVCAGAVVTRDVPSHSMVAGVPARVIRRLESTPISRTRALPS
jgi:acetyltransferase-like isoleucine patch superfamily enzyme